MARTREYHHFCPVARALEVIGEKWSLLIVRDLLRGPQRFSDLARFLGDITPKWLTLRLRELEAAGIVQRDAEPGRREVWYRLTAKGRELAPVVESLGLWGIEHAMRTPLPGETVHPAHATVPFVTYLNHRGVRLAQPVTWVVRFRGGRSYTVRFDGERWSLQRGEEPADVVIETTSELWTSFLTGTLDERRQQLDQMQVTGTPARIEEFVSTLGRRDPEAVSAAAPASGY
jgi:DNA-binding HxlR family transcriptional regulator